MHDSVRLLVLFHAAIRIATLAPLPLCTASSQSTVVAQINFDRFVHCTSCVVLEFAVALVKDKAPLTLVAASFCHDNLVGCYYLKITKPEQISALSALQANPAKYNAN